MMAPSPQILLKFELFSSNHHLDILQIIPQNLMAVFVILITR